VSIQLNHTIVWCRDKQKSAGFMAEIFGLPPPAPFGPMLVVQVDNGVSLDFYEKNGEISAQHYAFLVSEEDFDRIFARIQERGLCYWADPGKRHVRARSAATMAAGAYISMIQTGICWRSSRGLTRTNNSTCACQAFSGRLRFRLPRPACRDLCHTLSRPRKPLAA